MSEIGTDEPLTPKEQQQLIDLLSHPLIFPQGFKDWISELTRGEVTSQLPFSQILQSDTLAGSVATFAAISPTYVTPTLTWKDAGSATVPGPCKAMIFFTGSSYNWAGDYGYLALAVNGAAEDLTQRMAFRGESGRRVFGARAQYVDLPLASNTVKLRCMKDGSGDVDFQDLCMAIFRIFLVS